MDDQLQEIQDEIGQLIERLDELVYDAMRRQLHGEDAKAIEKRLSKARNALRRAYGLIAPFEADDLLDP